MVNKYELLCPFALLSRLQRARAKPQNGRKPCRSWQNLSALQSLNASKVSWRSRKSIFNSATSKRKIENKALQLVRNKGKAKNLNWLPPLCKGRCRQSRRRDCYKSGREYKLIYIWTYLLDLIKHYELCIINL